MNLLCLLTIKRESLRLREKVSLVLKDLNGCAISPKETFHIFKGLLNDTIYPAITFPKPKLMRLFVVLFLALPMLSIGQALNNNYYLNSEAGFSIKFDKNWKVKIPEKATHAVFAAKSKHQTVSIGLQPVGSDFKPEYTKEEADAAKPQIENALKARKVKIDKISVTPGVFQGKKCLITIAHLTETRDEDRVPVYHKTIQFVYRGNLFNILYNIPLSKLNELESMEKQLKTMKFF